MQQETKLHPSSVKPSSSHKHKKKSSHGRHKVATPDKAEEKKLSHIRSLKFHFNQGNLEITPDNQDDLLQASLQYESAFSKYDKGIVVQGWKASKDVSSLVDLLLGFNDIKSLKLHIDWDEDNLDAAKRIAKAFQFYGNLEELIMSDCHFTDTSMDVILGVLPAPAKLKTLDVRNNALNEVTLKKLQALFPNLTNLQSDFALEIISVKTPPVTPSIISDQKEHPTLSTLTEAQSDYEEGERCYKSKEYAEAREYYEKAAALGHTEAQIRLGNLYQNGEGVPKDYAKAIELYLKVAEKANKNVKEGLDEHVSSNKAVLPKPPSVSSSSSPSESADKPIVIPVVPQKQSASKSSAQSRDEKKHVSAKQTVLLRAPSVSSSSSSSESVPVVSQKQSASQSSAQSRDKKKDEAQINFEYDERILREEYGLEVQGDAKAELQAGMICLLRQEYEQARGWLGKAAARGDLEALLLLGASYVMGTPQDCVKAKELIEKAAVGGHVKAQYQMALFCINNKGYVGLSQDYNKAREWLKKAANQGNSDAQYKLATAYKEGDIGLSQDYNKAREWYEKAAAKGHGEAKQCLETLTSNIIISNFNKGNKYYHNKDYAQAKTYYEKAANQGHANAQLWLGILYYHGQGVPQNYNKAKGWFQKAANQGDAGGQKWLGALYYHGQGVHQDYNKAKGWFQKAAAQGNGEAQFWIGDLYHHGKGVHQNDEKAKGWYQRAVAQGNEEAKRRLKTLDSGVIGSKPKKQSSSRANGPSEETKKLTPASSQKHHQYSAQKEKTQFKADIEDNPHLHNDRKAAVAKRVQEMLYHEIEEDYKAYQEIEEFRATCEHYGKLGAGALAYQGAGTRNFGATARYCDRQLANIQIANQKKAEIAARANAKMKQHYIETGERHRLFYAFK